MTAQTEEAAVAAPSFVAEAQRLLAAARTRHGADANLHWVTGLGLRRAIFEFGVKLSHKMLAVSDIKPVPRRYVEHYLFCNIPAFVNASMEPATAILFAGDSPFGAIHCAIKEAA